MCVFVCVCELGVVWVVYGVAVHKYVKRKALVLVESRHWHWRQKKSRLHSESGDQRATLHTQQFGLYIFFFWYTNIFIFFGFGFGFCV